MTETKGCIIRIKQRQENQKDRKKRKGSEDRWWWSTRGSSVEKRWQEWERERWSDREKGWRKENKNLLFSQVIISLWTLLMRHELRGRESLSSREITLQAQNSSSEVEEGCKESHGRRGEEKRDWWWQQKERRVQRVRIHKRTTILFSRLRTTKSCVGLATRCITFPENNKTERKERETGPLLLFTCSSVRGIRFGVFCIHEGVSCLNCVRKKRQGIYTIALHSNCICADTKRKTWNQAVMKRVKERK